MDLTSLRSEWSLPTWKSWLLAKKSGSSLRNLSSSQMKKILMKTIRATHNRVILSGLRMIAAVLTLTNWAWRVPRQAFQTIWASNTLRSSFDFSLRPRLIRKNKKVGKSWLLQVGIAPQPWRWSLSTKPMWIWLRLLLTKTWTSWLLKTLSMKMGPQFPEELACNQWFRTNPVKEVSSSQELTSLAVMMNKKQASSVLTRE